MARPVVLVVDDDPAIRRLVRTALELEGVGIIEAASIAQARTVLEQVDAVILDRELPDGDGLDVLAEFQDQFGSARVVFHSNRAVPDELLSAPKGDLDALFDALRLDSMAPPAEKAPNLARQVSSEVVEAWLELCRWDPEQPPESQPPLAGSVVDAVTAALERPQPIGWGLDPALESVAEAYMLNAAELDVAVSQLVCLREAFERCVVERVASDQLDVARRLTMILQRLTMVVVRAGVQRLQAQAFTDPLTGLLNRRAFDTDLKRETARATRHDRILTVVAIDVDGLKAVNDAAGHAEGDRLLRGLGSALASTLRAEDGAYRIGGDEFALILPDTVLTDVSSLRSRLADQGAPACSVGVATYPIDPIDELVTRADWRLYEGRSRRATSTDRHSRADPKSLANRGR